MMMEMVILLTIVMKICQTMHSGRFDDIYNTFRAFELVVGLSGTAVAAVFALRRTRIRLHVALGHLHVSFLLQLTYFLGLLTLENYLEIQLRPQNSRMTLVNSKAI